MIFLKDFYNEHDHVNTKNNWVWYLHAVSYTYIIFVYFFTDAAKIDRSEASKMWVPLDILLTGCIFLYYMFYSLIENEDHHSSSDDEDEIENEEKQDKQYGIDDSARQSDQLTKQLEGEDLFLQLQRKT